MELRHFRYFVTLAEELHFGRAAERLGIAPPTLSVQIQQIEQRLGAQLLDRSNRRVRLTGTGLVFYEEAKRVLRSVDEAVARGIGAARGETGHVTIGYVGSVVLLGILQTSIIDFRTQWPGIATTVREVPMGALAEQVADGVFDLAFVRGPVAVPVGVRSAVVHRDSFCIALPTRHRLVGEAVGPIEAEKLIGEHFIVPEQESGTIEVGRRGGFAPDIVNRPGTLLQVLSQVALGMGVAVVPGVLRRTIDLEGVTYADIQAPPIESNVSILWKPDSTRPAMARFVDLVMSRFGVDLD